MQHTDYPTWAELLREAVSRPGLISEAYRRFHGYSLGNQLLALAQCHARGLQPGPISTFVGWKDLGCHVKRGEKALTLCMPVTLRRRSDGEENEDNEEFVTRFVYRRNWFVLAQTDGQEYVPPAVPGWDAGAALAVLGIEAIPFAETDGNIQGYAEHGRIAVSPVAAYPLKTTVHEVAHVLLHQADGPMRDGRELPRNLKEVEAEGVALLVLDSLQLPGAEYCRGYIQSWLGTSPTPETSARRIFAVADRILRAGRAA